MSNRRGVSPHGVSLTFPTSFGVSLSTMMMWLILFCSLGPVSAWAPGPAEFRSSHLARKSPAQVQMSLPSPMAFAAGTFTLAGLVVVGATSVVVMSSAEFQLANMKKKSDAVPKHSVSIFDADPASGAMTKVGIFDLDPAAGTHPTMQDA